VCGVEVEPLGFSGCCWWGGYYFNCWVAGGVDAVVVVCVGNGN